MKIDPENTKSQLGLHWKAESNLLQSSKNKNNYQKTSIDYHSK